MKTRQLLVIPAALCALSLGLGAQPAEAPGEADDPVVVSIYGREYTAADIASIRKRIPTQFQQQTQHMNNRAFLETFGYLHALSHLAEESGLSEKEPYRTQLEFNNMNFLAQAYLQDMRGEIEVSEEDVENYYEAHKNDFKEVRVSAIYLNYTPVPELAEKQGKPVIPEMEAWGKAEKLLGELRAGADFAELAREHSEDAASAEKGGDLGFFKPDDQLSQKVKETIFAMDEGQISNTIKDGGRFYLFKATEVKVRPLAEVKGEFLAQVHAAKMQERLEEIRKEVKIEVKDPSFLEAMPGR